VEEALYDSAAMHDFVGIDLGREPVPDETTVCRLRHLLEQDDPGRQLVVPADVLRRHVPERHVRLCDVERLSIRQR
jgi:IS5 family transposase